MHPPQVGVNTADAARPAPSAPTGGQRAGPLRQAPRSPPCPWAGSAGRPPGRNHLPQRRRAQAPARALHRTAPRHQPMTLASSIPQSTWVRSPEMVSRRDMHILRRNCETREVSKVPPHQLHLTCLRER